MGRANLRFRNARRLSEYWCSRPNCYTLICLPKGFGRYVSGILRVARASVSALVLLPPHSICGSPKVSYISNLIVEANRLEPFIFAPDGMDVCPRLHVDDLLSKMTNRGRIGAMPDFFFAIPRPCFWWTS